MADLYEDYGTITREEYLRRENAAKAPMVRLRRQAGEVFAGARLLRDAVNYSAPEDGAVVPPPVKKGDAHGFGCDGTAPLNAEGYCSLCGRERVVARP